MIDDGKRAKELLARVFQEYKPHAEQLIKVLPYTRAEEVRSLVDEINDFLQGEYDVTAPGAFKGVDKEKFGVVNKELNGTKDNEGKVKRTIRMDDIIKNRSSNVPIDKIKNVERGIL